MVVNSALRLNMTADSMAPEQQAQRYQAALDMAEYAEAHGFSVVSVEEHHCAANGWLPAPLTMAGLIVGRTRRIGVNVTALLVPLYDPVRLAEDIAVLDLASNGRFTFVAGMGYRPQEYHAVGKDWHCRGQLMDDALATMLQAWTGEPFEYRGETIRVTPVPLTRPHPFFFVGGMSKAAARRAARFGLPFYPPMAMPDLADFYYQELARLGQTGFVYDPGSSGNAMIFIAEAPDQAWPQLAPYFLNETREYSSWRLPGVPRPSEAGADSVAELQAQGRYLVLSPAQCVARIKADPKATVVLHPLAGGIPLELAWNSLRLYVEQVLPQL